MILRCLTGIDYIVINCFYINTKTIFNLCLGQPVATHGSFAILYNKIEKRPVRTLVRPSALFVLPLKTLEINLSFLVSRPR
jgi:hypothetical protein